MSLQAVILAAGQGRRLLPLTRDIPKALLPLDGSRVVDIRKDLLPQEAEGENLGVVLFRRAALEVLKNVVRTMVARGEVNRWIPVAFREMLPLHPVHAVDIKGLPWIEIDFIQDLEQAQKEIYPSLR